MNPDCRILVGDCRQLLQTLNEASVQCCVTSPPYLWMRDYELAPVEWPEVRYAPMIGAHPVSVLRETVALGMEHTMHSFLGHLVTVFREVRRVLRADGTLWLNMGDSYASGGRGGGGSFMDERGDASWKGASSVNGFRQPPPGFRRKDMLGIPWRLAFALQADGWILRSEVVWEKPNCMPESADDRPTKAHEHVFMFSLGDTYYYDADAIRERVTGGAHTRGGGVGGKAVPPGRDLQGRIRQNARYGRSVRELVTHRNKRTVWSIPTEAYKGKHYATFPRALARTCILAGTSADGCCSICGAPRTRLVEVEGPSFNERTKGREPSSYANASLGNPHSFAVKGSHGHVARVRRTVGWAATCECGADVVPCTVLDSFSGSGTTGIEAVTRGRSYIGIDASNEYSREARARIGHARARAGLAGADEPAVAGAPLQLGLLGGKSEAQS